MLQLIFELLAEQAAMVAKADAVAGQVQCGKAVQEAGSQAAQAAVAQAGLGFDFLDFGKGFAFFRQTCAYILVNAQVDQVV